MEIRMTRSGAALRGAIIVGASMVAAALSDPQLHAKLPAWVWSLLGIVGVGLTTWRAFIDTSAAQLSSGTQVSHIGASPTAGAMSGSAGAPSAG